MTHTVYESYCNRRETFLDKMSKAFLRIDDNLTFCRIKLSCSWHISRVLRYWVSRSLYFPATSESCSVSLILSRLSCELFSEFKSEIKNKKSKQKLF